jgi:hypothetical protein
MVSPHRVISWPICSVTLTEFVRSHAPVQLAPSHVPDRLFRRENSVNVTQQFSEETGFLARFSGTFVLGLRGGPRAEEAWFAITPIEGAVGALA